MTVYVLGPEAAQIITVENGTVTTGDGRTLDLSELPGFDSWAAERAAAYAVASDPLREAEAAQWAKVGATNPMTYERT